MSELARPESLVQNIPRLRDVATALDMDGAPDAYKDFAQDLGMIDRILQDEHRTGLEPGLELLIPFANRCELDGAPTIFHDRRNYARWWRDTALKEHDDMLTTDQKRANTLLIANPHLVLATNPSDEPFARVTSTEVITKRDVTKLVAYSGTVALGMLPARNIVCDVSRLPSFDMQRFVEQSSLLK